MSIAADQGDGGFCFCSMTHFHRFFTCFHWFYSLESCFRPWGLRVVWGSVIGSAAVTFDGYGTCTVFVGVGLVSCFVIWTVPFSSVGK